MGFKYGIMGKRVIEKKMFEFTHHNGYVSTVLAVDVIMTLSSDETPEDTSFYKILTCILLFPQI